MPARIVVVHDDPEFTQALAERLGPDVAVFDEPIQALDLLKRARTVDFLITRLAFGNKQPVGLSLARVTRSARPSRAANRWNERIAASRWAVELRAVLDPSSARYARRSVRVGARQSTPRSDSQSR